MPLNGCLLAARLRTPEARPLLEARLAELVRFYSPLGEEARLSERFSERLGLLAGLIRFDGRRADPRRPLVWGRALPGSLRTGTALVLASDDELRALPGPLAAVGLGRGGARILTSAGGVTSLYHAASEEVEAWSSHAVAAGWLAHGRAAIDPGAVAELLASEFVGGDRTLLDGVRAVPAATTVELRPEGATERSFWPRRERWAPVPEEEAQGLAEAVLVDDLSRSLEGATHPVLGLTSGLDSRALAVAMRELGATFRAFTFGDPQAGDAVGAARVAADLGVGHEFGPFEWWSEEHGMSRLEVDVRWSEAGAPVGFGRVPWPSPLSHWVAGVGAETGRSFYYRWTRPRGGEPSPAALHRALTLPMEARLAGSRAEAVDAVRSRWRSLIEDAAALGHSGWRVLDVLYAEQRVRRWGRGMAPRLSAALVPGFASPRLLAALASLPLEDRLTDAFGRRFIAARAPGLEPRLVAPARRGLITPGRRHAARLGLGSLRRGLGLPAPRRAGTRWYVEPPWDARGRYVEWLTDAVLDSPLLARAVGLRWGREVRRRFLAGDPAAAEITCLAGAPVALESALRSLGR